MREISPAVGMTVDEWLNITPSAKPIAEAIRSQKRAGTRPHPSATLIDGQATALSPAQRRALVDEVARLVDENWAGRSEMCEAFSHLVARALSQLGIPSVVKSGTATYPNPWFEWGHFWVEVQATGEVIDANSDSMAENPCVPEKLVSPPYWGPKANIPSGRRLKAGVVVRPTTDPDVETWWEDLQPKLAEIKGIT